jgi:hypothetical protein
MPKNSDKCASKNSDSEKYFLSSSESSESNKHSNKHSKKHSENYLTSSDSSKHKKHNKKKHELHSESITIFTKNTDANSSCTSDEKITKIKPFNLSVLKGETGCSGSKGKKGSRGKKGPRGPRGPRGHTGPAGPPGQNFVGQGLVGPQGLTGPVGPTGPQGDVGPVGPTGPRGDAGPVGSVGSAGPQGDVGPVGPAGPQGLAGPVGPTGSAGPVGPQGLTGPAGPAGPEGPPGAQGLAGGLIDYAYYYNTEELALQTNSIIQFNNTPITSSGIIYANGNITLINDGVYTVTSYILPNQNSQFAFYLNGIVIPESVYNSLNGYFMKSFPANATLTFVNTTNNSVIVPVTNNTGLYTGINASVLIERIA